MLATSYELCAMKNREQLGVMRWHLCEKAEDRTVLLYELQNINKTVI